MGLITSRHYLSEHNKNGGTSGTSGDNEDEQNLSTSSKCEVIGSLKGMGMVGFCFGIGLILAAKTVNNLEHCIEEPISRK